MSHQLKRIQREAFKAAGCRDAVTAGAEYR